jgi:hypothetical protein
MVAKVDLQYVQSYAFCPIFLLIAVHQDGITPSMAWFKPF